MTVPVTDQDRAKNFYVDTLGFEVVIDKQAGPVRWLQIAPQGAQTSFILATAEQGFVPGSLKGLQLETTDLDGDCARLTEAGVDVDLAELPWGRRANLSDPDGNAIVLSGPAPGKF